MFSVVLLGRTAGAAESVVSRKACSTPKDAALNFLGTLGQVFPLSDGRPLIRITGGAWHEALSGDVSADPLRSLSGPFAE